LEGDYEQAQKAVVEMVKAGMGWEILVH
jgi:hypothetical protein